jgi:hypothetical protein
MRPRASTDGSTEIHQLHVTTTPNRKERASRRLRCATWPLVSKALGGSVSPRGAKRLRSTYIVYVCIHFGGVKCEHPIRVSLGRPDGWMGWMDMGLLECSLTSSTVMCAYSSTTVCRVTCVKVARIGQNSERYIQRDTKILHTVTSPSFPPPLLCPSTNACTAGGSSDCCIAIDNWCRGQRVEDGIHRRSVRLENPIACIQIHIYTQTHTCQRHRPLPLSFPVSHLLRQQKQAVGAVLFILRLRPRRLHDGAHPTET